MKRKDFFDKTLLKKIDIPNENKKIFESIEKSFISFVQKDKKSKKLFKF